ncbi:HAD-superfamily subfamily IIID h [Daedalea quercina L-15889]|uniref:protein-serine/threonine phosphatase n=1 Tax=Daedalea quercina L-15889 TaxID=1314783 RepID=A0A165QQP3_9APHY|nr:HAD-superfamily subfamily IIID h [Daedalea quercina L-15889]
MDGLQSESSTQVLSAPPPAHISSATQVPLQETIDLETSEHATTITAVQETSPPLTEAEISEKWVHLYFTWSGKPFELDVAESDRVDDLKALLQSLTDVPPERQKILGLVKGKQPPDEETIANLKLVSGRKFTLVGTPQGQEIKDPSQLEFLPDVVNDLDIDFSANPAAAEAYINDRRNQRKIRESTRKLEVNVIHPLREGKRLLVLDLDYTILDTKPLTSGALPPHECARPRLHEFLEAIYPYYDICIWSQTSWIWLETKLVELGMIGGGHNYEISFVLDKKPMFIVFSRRDGRPYKHHVKALQIIWNHFPQFNASNTIHVDDLGRNFALNPGEGLKIAPFKDAHLPQAMVDRELDKLTRYMVHIATVHQDFRDVDHKNWQHVVRGLPPA